LKLRIDVTFEDSGKVIDRDKVEIDIPPGGNLSFAFAAIVVCHDGAFLASRSRKIMIDTVEGKAEPLASLNGEGISGKIWKKFNRGDVFQQVTPKGKKFRIERQLVSIASK